MTDTAQDQRAGAIKSLAYLRDRYSLEEICAAGRLLNDSAEHALDTADVAPALILAIAASCITVVHSILTEQGAE